MKPGLAWITGGSSGIGRAIAVRLVADGWKVAASARSADALAEFAASPEAKGQVFAYPVDVTDRQAMIATADAIEAAHGPIDLLLCSAGSYVAFGLADWSADKLMNLMKLNVGGVANALEAMLPRFVVRDRGHIAIVSSLTQYRGMGRTAAYGASKSALLTIAESLRLLARGTGIKVQIIVPGYVATPMSAGAPFPLPHIITAEDAAERTVRGLATSRFEIAMPKRMVMRFQFARFLPPWLYFWWASRDPLFGARRPAPKT